jgi:hypothetical protein
MRFAVFLAMLASTDALKCYVTSGSTTVQQDFSTCCYTVTMPSGVVTYGGSSDPYCSVTASGVLSACEGSDLCNAPLLHSSSASRAALGTTAMAAVAAYYFA